jgi:polysaccharide export outer membrane protein
MKFSFRGIFLVAVFLMFMPASVLHAGDYIIGEGDKLQIAVWGVASLNFEVKVRPDGMITVPGLGDVSASGRRPEDLKKELTERLKDLVKNPIVTVTVSDITNTKVFIFGNGTKPGIYDISRKTTLLQILCSLSDIKSADLKRAYLLRNNTKVKEGFDRLFISGDIAEDVPIEANDALFIPAYADKSVYVTGGVNTPKAIEYRDGISVMEAILEAGGFNKFASQNDTTIIRKENGKEISLPVKAKKLINNLDLSQNLKLKPGDFVVVEESIF